MRHPALGPAVVTFDKGGRVARLAPGARLDARQVGILFAQLGAPAERQAHLLEWDRDRDPNATRRIEGLLSRRGPDDKQTLLLALSMGVLTRFEVRDPAQGVRYLLEGDRSAGYSVVDQSPV